MTSLTPHIPLAHSNHHVTPQQSYPNATESHSEAPQPAYSDAPVAYQQAPPLYSQHIHQGYGSDHLYKQPPPPYYAQPMYNPQRLSRNSKGHKSTCIRLESFMIAGNSAFLTTEAVLTGLTLGGLGPIFAPLMALHAALIVHSATTIARKRKARKYGF